MQFVHSQEQQLIRSSARGVLAAYTPARLRAAWDAARGYDEALWQQMSAGLGWSALAVPERYGGAGLGWVELCILEEELGRQLVASPFFGTVVLAGALLRECADEAQCRALLPRIAAGSVRIACALAGSDGRPPPEGVALQLQERDGALQLQGVADFVIHADGAELLLVVARSAPAGELSLALLPPGPGITIEPHVMLDLTRPMARVSFEGVRLERTQLLGAQGSARTGIERALSLARIALASESLGGAEKVLEMTTEYVKQRVQFGRPIGSFQALKHRLADMMVAVEAAKSAAWYAACVADEGGGELAEAAAIAKSYCCDAFYECAASAIQLHGGIGYTWEHDVHLYFKRARATATLLGSPAWQRERLLRELGLGAAAVPSF